MLYDESRLAIDSRPDIAAPQPEGRRTLLWVDDSRPTLALYKAVFERLGFDVQATCSPYEALEHLGSQAADVAIVDYEIPEMDGGELAALIKGRHPDLPVILYSGRICIPPDTHRWVDAICSKGAPPKELLAAIEKILAQQVTRILNRHSATRFTT